MRKILFITSVMFFGLAAIIMGAGRRAPEEGLHCRAHGTIGKDAGCYHHEHFLKEDGCTIRGSKEEEIGMQAVCAKMDREFTVDENTKIVECKDGSVKYLCCPACK